MSDLSVLFDKDPLSLTSDDKATIARAYREAQVKFAVGGDMKAGSSKKIKEGKPKIEDLTDLLDL